MSYKTELQSNNADLQTILDMVNALPEGGGGAAEITFSIVTNTITIYTAQEGMTWGDWVYSKYNTDGYYVSGNFVLNSLGNVLFDDTTSSAVKPTSVIASGYSYMICCFVPGTQIMVSLDGETQAIEEIEAGDTVVSYNPETGENYLARVTASVINPCSVAMAHVEFANGTELDMTVYHPLYTKNGWHSLTKPEYDVLVVGDEVKTVNGWSKITKIVRYHLAEAVTTYSLAVADFGEDPDDDTNDNFYANGIMAHNAGPNCVPL